ncbi:MAG: hypothetical protein AAGA08_14915 [Pseudomonadota bacterium]
MKPYLLGMARLVFALTLAFLPLTALADDPATPEAPFLEGIDELADGIQKLFDSLSNEVSPLMDDLADQLKGLNAYHPPEVLPNGDIIIRRKTPKEIEPTPDAKTDEVIDI